ncbi:MAG: glycosyltransferase family 4 protein [Aquabacterium sp.]|uniref:glycosyltransferase family 4 protein n=1 Tax=Aquabacterium sp. TaxID=1872578 RepID=UPI0025BA6669|nr:glycosyltransferase family 4 protein [Aquabacterium sp.]MBI5925432.1 glycosyltransferase family 4 protein [Aquabacterium sp.]
MPQGASLAETLKSVAGDFDFIVARPGDQLVQLMKVLPSNVRVIAWAHNHLRGPMLKWLGRERRVVAVVNVGREQMLLTRLSACYAKSTWIDNPVYEAESTDGERRGCRAVYMGALVPSKGFLSLAKMWPAIKEAVPDAQLDVIGSVDLYGAGSGGVGYIEKVRHHLGHNIEDAGVCFHGKLGVQKADVMNQALVGLPNPTGFTETSCLSALEMSSAGLALVVPHRWGYCDTVNPAQSGVFASGGRSYVRSVAALLNNPDSARRIGATGRQWVSDNFSYDRICQEWQGLFQRLLEGKALRKQAPTYPTGRYPHGLLYRFDFLGPYAQPLVDVTDKVVGWNMRR